MGFIDEFKVGRQQYVDKHKNDPPDWIDRQNAKIKKAFLRGGIKAGDKALTDAITSAAVRGADAFNDEPETKKLKKAAEGWRAEKDALAAAVAKKAQARTDLWAADPAEAKRQKESKTGLYA